jgi:hypothetical protein
MSAQHSTPVLPGLSRSAACRTKSCQRLAGHKGEHRTSLHAAVTKSPALQTITVAELAELGFRLATTKVVRQARTTSADEVGVEVHSADRYTVQPDRPVASPRRTKSRAQKACRISKAGVRCSRAYGHKQAGTRHSFAGVTVVAPAADPSRVQAQRPARRGRYVASSKPSSRLA